ncbi:hypothetical protein SAMN05421730_103722, partial [Anaerobium acetethylicum]
VLRPRTLRPYVPLRLHLSESALRMNMFCITSPFAYSFTAPDVMPPTIYFCPSIYTMMTGIHVRMISAKI